MARVGLTVERLVDAAGEMADAEGFAALTLAAMARRFGVQLASLYAHVRNADDLKAQVALEGLGMLADRVDEAIAGWAGAEAIIALGEVHRQFAIEHPGLFEAARFPLSAEQAAGSGGMRISRAMLAALRGFDLDGADSVHAVRILGSYFLGFSMLEQAGSFAHSQPAPDMSWRHGLEALVGMLEGWSQSKSAGKGA